MTPDEVRKLPGKVIKSRRGYFQIADNRTIVTFGKYRGRLLSTLLEDTGYVAWIQQEPGMIDNLCASYPLFGAALEAAIGAGTAQTPHPNPAPKASRRVTHFANDLANLINRHTPTVHVHSGFNNVRIVMETIRDRLFQVSDAELKAATPGQRYLHELVEEAYNRSMETLLNVSADTAEAVLNQMIVLFAGIWKDLPAPSDWWFGKDPVLQRKARASLVANAKNKLV